MAKSSAGVIVCTARPAYAYRDDDGTMVEHHLDQEFIADTYLAGLDGAIAWARCRYESYMKDAYPESFLSSLKVSTKFIGRISAEGISSTRSQGVFFEWKYDFPGTLDVYRNMWLSERGDISHTPIS
jgi:hypothetical protein